MMCTSTTEIANTAKNRKDGRAPRSVVTPRPFVVCSITTKRYAPSTRVPVKKPSTIPPSAMKQGIQPRPCPFPRDVPKAEPSRSVAKPVSLPASQVQKTLRLPPVASLRQKLSVNKPTTIVHRDKLTAEPPPRPSCIPRCRDTDSSRGKRVGMLKVSSAGPCDKAPSKLSVSIPTFKDAVRVTGRNIKKLTVTRTTAKPVVHAKPFDLAPCATQSPPPSPDLSSFPSQSWTIVVDVGIKPVKVPTTICDPDTSSNTSATEKSDPGEFISETYPHSESVSSSPTPSSSPTAIEDSSSPATLAAEFGDTGKLCGSTSNEVSQTICDATIVSPSSSIGSPSSRDLLARVIDSQASPPPGALGPDNSTRTTVQRAIELARTLFSPSRPAPKSTAETAFAGIMRGNVSRLRNLFIPPLDEDVKASRNPATQMEIEMLRARKKVAGGGVVDPRLERLDSLSSMAIAAKRLGTPGSDSSSQA